MGKKNLKKQLYIEIENLERFKNLFLSSQAVLSELKDNLNRFIDNLNKIVWHKSKLIYWKIKEKKY